jgi:hypothetical protein
MKSTLLEQVLLRVSSFPPANYDSAIAPFSSITAIAMARQHIATFLVFKLGAASVVPRGSLQREATQ